MSFLAGLVSDNSMSFEKFKLGSLSSQPPLKKNLCTGSEFFVHGYLRVRFDLSSFIDFRHINANWMPKTLIKGHHRGPRVTPLDSNGMIS